jgi:hypothetical protein
VPGARGSTFRGFAAFRLGIGLGLGVLVVASAGGHGLALALSSTCLRLGACPTFIRTCRHLLAASRHGNMEVSTVF